MALVQVQKGVCMSQKITKDSLKSECCLRLSKCWHHRYRYLPPGLIEGALLHQVTRTCVDIQHPIFQQQSEPSPPGGWFCSPTALLAYTLTNISTHSYTPPTEITPFCFSRLKIKWNKKREKNVDWKFTHNFHLIECLLWILIIHYREGSSGEAGNQSTRVWLWILTANQIAMCSSSLKI